MSTLTKTTVGQNFNPLWLFKKHRFHTDRSQININPKCFAGPAFIHLSLRSSHPSSGIPSIGDAQGILA